jgi:hypothetical protein
MSDYGYLLKNWQLERPSNPSANSTMEAYGNMHQNLSRIMRDLGTFERALRGTAFSLKSMRECLDHLEQVLPSEVSLEEETFLLKERLQFSAGFIDALESTHNEIQQRVKSMVQEVYNLIQQRDSAVNIDLAAQSKLVAERSHSEALAMRTISILTMLFLPATFVAVSLREPSHCPSSFLLGSQLHSWKNKDNRVFLVLPFLVHWAEKSAIQYFIALRSKTANISRRSSL